MKKTLVYSLLAATCFGFSSFSLAVQANNVEVANYQRYPLVMDQKYYIQSSAANKKDFPKGLNAAFGSGLAYEGKTADGAPKLLSITDRGPNLDGMTVISNGKKYPSKLFPTPNFHPEIGEIVLKDKVARVVSATPIKDQQGKPISGRPIPQGKVGSSGEVALSYDLKVLPYDTEGLDTESIAIDHKTGNLWLSDEYGPFVVKMDKNAKIINRYAPGKELPAIAAERTPNRGAEGLTLLPNGNVFFLIQSILTNKGETKKATICRFFVWNPTDNSYKTYAYPLEHSYSKMTAAKIGDAFAIDNNRVLIIEQGVQADKSMMNKVYMVDLSKAPDITNIKINGKNLEYATPSELAPYVLPKTEILNLRQYGWDTEKAEGLTLSPDHKTMYVANDNDFGIATAIEDKDHPNASVEDYIYNADTKTMYYKDKKGQTVVAKPKIKMEIGPDKAEVWSFTFKDSLDTIFPNK